MDLAFNFLLILLIELPIIGFFFRKRKRNKAMIIGLLVNAITWPIANIIRLNTSWNLNYVQVGIIIFEGFAYWLLMGRNWKKAIIITLLANLSSFFITKYVYLPPDFFQKKNNIIR